MWAIINSYRVEILLSAISISVGFIVGYIFYRLQKRDVASVERERVKRAKEELLNVIESHIINKQQFAEELIHNLIVASEREHQVGLKDFCTPTTLLQDVELRLQKSGHLDIAQKREYSDQIEQTIATIEEQRNEVPEEAKEPLEFVGVLEDAIQNGETQKGLETIALLKEKLTKAPIPVRAEYATKSERLQLMTSLITGISVIIATFLLTSEYTDLPIDRYFTELLLAIMAAVTLTIAFATLKHKNDLG